MIARFIRARRERREQRAREEYLARFIDYHRADESDDDRGRGQRWPALRDAMCARLKAEAALAGGKRS